MDRREFVLSGLEIKAAAEEKGEMSFSGYGAVFGNVDACGDVIAKGAFAATIANFKAGGVWPAMLAQHGGWGMGADDITPVGAWVDIKEDDHGLFVEGKFADTARGKELYSLLKMTPRPAINGMSIGYRPVEWIMRNKSEEPRRTLTKIDLVEISLVTFPANDKARVTGVKNDGEMPSVRELEQSLRDAGCSRAQAKAVLAGGYKTAPLRDAEEKISEVKEIVLKSIRLLDTQK